MVFLVMKNDDRVGFAATRIRTVFRDFCPIIC